MNPPVADPAAHPSSHLASAGPRAELDRLQESLATRGSTTCFAQFAVGLMVAIIFAGASGKLFWDSVRTPLLALAGTLVALGLAAFAVSRYLRGKRLLAEELAQFERMEGLRRELRLDDPSALLPDR